MSDLSPPSPPSPPLSDRRRRGHRDDESALVYHQGDHHGVYQHHREDEHRDSAEEEDDDDEQQPRSASAAQQQQQQHALPHNRGPTRSATPPRHTSTGAYQSTSPAQNAANGKERSLMDLLAKAASEIRVERRKVRQLLDDNERLKGEVTSLKGRQAQAVRHQQSSSANKEIAELKNKYSDLMTAHKAMSVELEQCKEQLQTWQSRCKEQQRVLLQNQQQQGAAAAPRSRAGSPSTQTNLAYAQRNGGRTAGATTGGSAGARQPAGASSQQQHHNPTAQYGRADSQAQQQQRGGAVSSSRRSGSAHVPFDAMASQGLARSPPRVMGTAAAVTGGHSTATMANRSSRSRSQQQHADPSTAATSRPAQHAAARAASPSHNTSLDSGAPQQHQQSQLQPQREAVLAAEERQFNDLMLSRLRRAIAPAPTKEQMSEVVHAMVQELVKSAARNGLHLELKRVGNSAYQCGRRRLNLTVDSRRLVVKCGGGHVDMNEFVQRNRLWTAMENPNN